MFRTILKLAAGCALASACFAQTTVVGLSGWMAERVSEAPLALGYQLVGGLVLADGRFLYGSRDRIGPEAEMAIILREPDGTESVLVEPNDYPAGDRLITDFVQDPLDPNRILVLDGGSWNPDPGTDGRIHELRLGSGQISTVLAGLANPLAGDFDQNGVLYIADRGNTESASSGALLRWDGVNLTSVISGRDMQSVLVLDTNRLLISSATDGPTRGQSYVVDTAGSTQAVLFPWAIQNTVLVDGVVYAVGGGLLTFEVTAGNETRNVTSIAINMANAFGGTVGVQADGSVLVFEREVDGPYFLAKSVVKLTPPPAACKADIDGDGSVALSDLAILLSQFGAACGL